MKHQRNLQSNYEKYFVTNVDYEKRGSKNKIITFLKLLYSFVAKKNIARLIRNENPAIAHLSSIYHQISPPIIHSLRKGDIPTVMTLRFYKKAYASYLMLNNGKVCEACKN